MTAPDLSEHFDYLAGQVHALRAVVMVLVRTHPNPAELLLHLDGASQVATAKAEGEMVLDSYIEGLTELLDEMRSAALRNKSATSD